MRAFNIYEDPDFSLQDDEESRRDIVICTSVAAVGVAATAVLGALASVRLGLAPTQLVSLVKHVGLS